MKELATVIAGSGALTPELIHSVLRRVVEEGRPGALPQAATLRKIVATTTPKRRQRIWDALVDACENAMVREPLLRLFGWWNRAGAQPTDLASEDALAAVELFDDVTPLRYLLYADPVALAMVSKKARDRLARVGRRKWRLPFDSGLGQATTRTEALARLFTLLALPLDEEAAIRLALDHSGPGAEGRGALLAAAAWLRTRHQQARPRPLPATRAIDGGAREKMEGIFELLLAAHAVSPPLADELRAQLDKQIWWPERRPVLEAALSKAGVGCPLAAPRRAKGPTSYAFALAVRGSDQWGGAPPAFEAATSPVCAQCEEPMRFLALFRAHPARLPLKHHDALAVFCCQSDNDCESWRANSGCNAALLLAREQVGHSAPRRVPGVEDAPARTSRPDVHGWAGIDEHASLAAHANDRLRRRVERLLRGFPLLDVRRGGLPDLVAQVPRAASQHVS